MGWKGTVRSFAAAGRRIERENQRQVRVATQQFKQLQKQEELADASAAVASYDSYVGLLKNIHHECSDAISWSAFERESAPPAPKLGNTHELNAQAALDFYLPSFFDKLFGRTERKRKQLAAAVEEANQRDQQLFAEQQTTHEQAVADWQDRRDLARQVLARDVSVYRQVFEVFTPFAGIDALGTDLEFTFTADHIEVDVHVNSVEIIPDFIVSRLASGKLSRKTLPPSKFNELYQDYVCGCLLRVAREVQAHLPVSIVVVHAVAKQLNPTTGHIEPQVIVSAAMPRQTLDQLRFVGLDPSDAMRNFNHAMKFAKTTGFQFVNRVGLTAPLPTKR